MIRQRIPGSAIGDRTTRVWLALHDLHARNGRVTQREVAAATGLPLSTAHAEIRDLVARGLVESASVKGGLRPTLVLMARSLG